MAITFRELSVIAELHYGKLPDAFKAKAGEFFDALDQNGDGAVTLQELLSSNLEGKFGQEFLQHVFYSLDEEGKGLLEFRECLTLYYLCMYSARVCAACGQNIPHGLGYTCWKCWREGQPPNNEFSVCLECFSSHNYQHEHNPLHLLHDFVLFDNLLHGRPSSPSTVPIAPVRAVEQTVKQCIICGDYHESTSRGFMSDVHMSKMRGSTDQFVCEWCFSYLCSKCGNLFRDSTTRAEPGKWLQRFVCPSCHPKNVASDYYDASIKRLQNVLSGAELLRQCKTCEIKQRNGTLFWIVNGTNTAAAAPDPQPWAPPPNTRSRSSSFDQQPQMQQTYSGAGSGSFHGSVGRDNMVHGGGGHDGGSSHGSSSRRNYGGPVNHMNMQPEVPRRGATSFNRPNINSTAASAVRTFNRMVNAAAANVFNTGGGAGGGGGGNSGGAGIGGNVGGGAFGGVGVGGGSSSSDSSGVDMGMANGGGNMTDVGADSGSGAFDASGLLTSLGNLMGSGGNGGDISGAGSIDATALLSSIGSLVVNSGDGSGGTTTWS